MEDPLAKPLQISGDLYNRIFTVHSNHPDVLVDYTVWNRILTALPRDYQLPDLPVLSRTVTEEGL